MTQGAKIGKRYPAVHNLTVANIQLTSQDIGKWRDAINSARSVLNPRRRLLYELYDNIILDGHLTAVMNKRRLSVQNKSVLFMQDGDEGKVNDSLRNNLLETPWFNKMLGYISDGIAPYGHSLIEFIPENGRITNCELINRSNVFPEREFFAWSYYDETNGVYYKLDPAYKDNMLAVGGKKDYGLLMVAAQYVIYKRGGFGDWARFAELFGIPFRTAYYNPYDDTTRKVLEAALQNAGAAPYLVLPDGSRLEVKDNNQQGKSEVFDMIIERCNSEVSKIFLGQTSTTDKASNRSQTQTHKEIENEVLLADLKAVEYVLNFDAKDKLFKWGFPVANGRFQFPEIAQLPMEKRLEMDLKLANHIAIDEEYWYETYGVPKPNTKPADDNNKPDDDDPDIDNKKNHKQQKKKIIPQNSVTLSLDSCCAVPVSAGVVADIAYKEAFSKFISKVWNDKAVYDFTFFETLTKIFTLGFNKGWAKDAPDNLPKNAGINRTINREYLDEDFEMLNFLEANIFQFAAANTLDIAQQMNKLLPKAKTFDDFKQAVDDAGIYVDSYRDLRTNYNLAYNTAYTSADYYRLIRDKDIYPSWQYVTAGDARVRTAHRALDGKIFPADDAVWNTIYPPNGYNCRCYVKPLQYEPKTFATKEQAMESLGDELTQMKAQGFDKNRSKMGVVFDLSKEYAKKLKANLEVKQMYGDENMQWEKLKETELPQRNISITSNEKAQEWFDGKKNADGKVIFKDHLNRNIALTEKTFKKNKINHQYVDLLDEIMSKPDEVWLTAKSAETFSYVYVKFYKDEMVIVLTKVDKGVATEITTFSGAADDAFRNGILVKSFE